MSAAEADADISLASVAVFSTYACKTVTRGRPHPGDIAEPASLSAVLLPATSYPLWDALPEEAISKGLLSQLQLEGVLHACAKHQEILPTGERCGFMIGDGAGVGKGRQIAAVIMDNYARGRRKHVWLSISTDLHLDATRDFRDLGCHINVINNCQSLDRESRALGLSKDFKEGCLFMTYSTLIASSSSKGKQSRMAQVVEWLGGELFDGCLVFDECHKAKNFGKEGSGTKVASTVVELQKMLPKARVLYCSATGVSEVANMAYLSRMGLWGQATAFRDFDAFLDTMKRRGVSFMEMLAMEMKMEGKYVARGLSFKDAEFAELSVPLTDVQSDVYDKATDVWRAVRRAMEIAIPMSGSSSGIVWRSFWSSQQRFFKLLCVSMKVPTVVAETKDALAKGYCVVIGLQTTGEAATSSVGTEVGPVSAFVSPTREGLRQYIMLNFPVRRVPKDGENGADMAGSTPTQKLAIMPPPPQHGETAAGQLLTQSQMSEEEAVNAELACMRSELLARVDELQLPPNFLDELIDEFGGPDNVSEMTGRKSRTVRDSRGYLRHEMRAKPDSSEMDSLNVKERQKFQAGKRLIAIISDAASTGISLHASFSVPNQRRRVHLTIELPWSADKAIQQLGRTHRSNQAQGPFYKLLSTNVGGEKRFAAAVARRLQSLGALTRGDRRAASGVDLSEQNFDSQLGRKSLRRMYDCLVLDSHTLPPGVQLKDIYQDHKDAQLFDFSGDKQLESIAIIQLHARLREHCDTMGVSVGGQVATASRPDTVISEDKPDKEGKELGDVKRFLNRLLGLHVDDQNLLFAYFFATLAAETRAAKSEGKLSEGLSDLRGRSVTLKSTQVLWKDTNTGGLTTTRNDFDIDRGVSFSEATAMLQLEAMAGDESGFMRLKRPIFGQRMCLLAVLKPGQRGVFTITKPNTGVSYFEMDREELLSRYDRLPVDSAELASDWDNAYQRTLTECMHGPDCKQGEACVFGRRISQATILSGSVVRLWGLLEQVLLRHENELSKADRTMRVVRVELDSNGRHMVGVRYPAALLPEVVCLLHTEKMGQEALQLKGKLSTDQIHHLYTQGQISKQAAEGFLLLLQSTAAGGSSTPGGTPGGGSTSGVKMTEPPTPLDPKSMAKMLKAPKTMLDFFRPQAASQQQPPASQQPPAASHKKQAAAQKQPGVTPTDVAGCGAAAAAAAAAVGAAGSAAAAAAGGGTSQLPTTRQTGTKKPTPASAYPTGPGGGGGRGSSGGGVRGSGGDITVSRAVEAALRASWAFNPKPKPVAAAAAAAAVVMLDKDAGEEEMVVVDHDRLAPVGSLMLDEDAGEEELVINHDSLAPVDRVLADDACGGDGNRMVMAGGEEEEEVGDDDGDDGKGEGYSPSHSIKRDCRAMGGDEEGDDDRDYVISDDDNDDGDDDGNGEEYKGGKVKRAKVAQGNVKPAQPSAYVPNPRPTPASVSGKPVAPSRRQGGSKPPQGSTSNSTGKQYKESEADVSKLVAMGFSREVAKKSLWLAHGNMQRAASLCLPH